MHPVASQRRFNCTCSKHNFGRPHSVSVATWYRHLQEAGSEEERRRIQDARFDGSEGSEPSLPRRARGRRRTNFLRPANDGIQGNRAAVSLCFIIMIAMIYLNFRVVLHRLPPAMTIELHIIIRNLLLPSTTLAILQNKIPSKSTPLPLRGWTLNKTSLKTTPLPLHQTLNKTPASKI